MPNCKKCGGYFPYSLVVDGKERYLHRRKFCLECSPFGKHNTRNLVTKPIANISCVACGAETKRGRCFCYACWSKMRRYQVKAAAVAYKGGKCIDCGNVVSIAAFDFHHRDPATKRFDIGPCANRSFKVIKEELDKCDLLCASCHRTRHSHCEQVILDYVASHPINFNDMGG